MLTESTPAEVDETARAFLQARVAAFGLFAGSMFTIFLVFRVILRIGSADSAHAGLLLEPSILLHAAAAAGLFFAWAVCGFGRHAVWLIRSVETISLYWCSAAMCAMAQYVPLIASPGHILLMALTCAVLARAVYVPSSWRRSLLLGLGPGAMIVASVYVQWLGEDLTPWKAFYPHLHAGSHHEVARSWSVYYAVWWLLSVLLSAAASRVIYGLRREVRSARQLGQYHLERKLGEGGMGAVYQARHAFLRRPTAVKLIKSEAADESNLRRFGREVQLTAALCHPNTISIFDYGRTPDGIFYYAMELIDGITLAQLVEVGGPVPASRAVFLLKQACAALIEAHGAGLVHRDLKPANLMIHGGAGLEDILKVLDFGLVKQLGSGESSVTQAGAITGTPQYMAPETIRAPESVGPLSDVYSLGCVAFFLLTGAAPFVGDSVVEVCGHHLHSEAPLLSERLETPADAALSALIADCLQKDATLRPQGARAFWQALERLEIAPWTTDDARAWWREQASSLEALRNEAHGTVAESLAIERGHGLSASPAA